MTRTLCVSRITFMGDARRVQVTLDGRAYAAVSRIARREGKKLAAVVREAVEQYCVAPEARRRRLEAIERLCAAGTVPAPESLAEWETEYSRLKIGLATGCLHTNDGSGSHEDS